MIPLSLKESFIQRPLPGVICFLRCLLPTQMHFLYRPMFLIFEQRQAFQGTPDTSLIFSGEYKWAMSYRDAAGLGKEGSLVTPEVRRQNLKKQEAFHLPALPGVRLGVACELSPEISRFAPPVCERSPPAFIW